MAVVVTRAVVRHAALGAALLCGCSSNVEPRQFELDCSVNDDYEFSVMQAMEPGPMFTWFAFGDNTPGFVRTVEIREIPGGRCGSTSALVMTALGHTDWGAGFGEYQMPTAPISAEGYEGISFWARAPLAHTSTGFLLTVNDRNTIMNGLVCTQPVVTAEDGAYTYNEAGMMVPVGGELPGPSDCGNGFQRVVTVTRNWQLYLLPFESFQQQAQPNRVPTGLDPTAVYQFTFNIPKDSIVELWVDDVGAYRRRTDEAPEPGASVVRDSIDSDDIDSDDIDSDGIEPDLER
jgi:hypothetical protein